MKKIILLTLASLICQFSFGKIVMFSVDMSGQVKSANGIHVMGDFQALAGFGPDWTPNTCNMLQDVLDTNLYHYTVDIPALAKYDYKFINGDQSYEVEVIPLASQVGYNFDDNRWVYVDSINTDTLKLPAFVFGANCAQGMNMIRFKVDMTTQAFTAAGVHVAGSFQGNDPTTTRMYSFGNNVYEIIAYMTAGSTYTYKYYSGNTSSDSETVPSGCSTGGDRTHALTVDTVLDNICFSSCSTCYPTSITHQLSAEPLEISPNPATETVSIRFANQLQHSLELIDCTGRIIRSISAIQEKQFELHRDNLLSGMYLMRIIDSGGKIQTEKLIFE